MRTPTLEQVTPLLMAAAAVYVVYKLSRAHQIGSDALKPLADGIGNLWTKLTQGPGVQGSFAYVVLKPRDFTNGYLNTDTRQAIETMHPGNAALLAQVLTPAGQLKNTYLPLLSAGGFAITQNGVEQL